MQSLIQNNEVYRRNQGHCHFLLFACIHLAVLSKWIPYAVVWGGRLKTDKEMYRFESVSLLMILFFLWVALEEAQIVEGFLSAQVVSVIFWVMAVLFALNTVGNLLLENRVERLVFTPLALLLAISCVVALLT